MTTSSARPPGASTRRISAAAVTLACPTGDPALFLRAATGLIAIDGDDALADEAQAVVVRIANSLPDPDMRRQFENAEPTRLISKRP